MERQVQREMTFTAVRRDQKPFARCHVCLFGVLHDLVGFMLYLFYHMVLVLSCFAQAILHVLTQSNVLLRGALT